MARAGVEHAPSVYLETHSCLEWFHTARGHALEHARLLGMRSYGMVPQVNFAREGLPTVLTSRWYIAATVFAPDVRKHVVAKHV